MGIKTVVRLGETTEPIRGSKDAAYAEYVRGRDFGSQMRSKNREPGSVDLGTASPDFIRGFKSAYSLGESAKLTEGPFDFIRGASREAGRKVANSAPVRAGREIVQAGRDASAAAELEKLVITYAKLLNATTKAQPQQQAQAQAQPQAKPAARQAQPQQKERPAQAAQGAPDAFRSASKPRGRTGPLGKDDFRWTFDSFLQATHGEQIDEGLWDFLGGAKNAAMQKVRDKIEKYGNQDSVIKDLYNAGRDASAAGDQRKEQSRLGQLQQKQSEVAAQIKAKAQQMGPAAAAAIKAALAKLPQNIRGTVAQQLGVN